MELNKMKEKLEALLLLQKEHEQKVLDLEQSFDFEKKEIAKLKSEIAWFDIPVCKHDYYAIRRGECKYGGVHNGVVMCSNPKCK